MVCRLEILICNCKLTTKFQNMVNILHKWNGDDSDEGKGKVGEIFYSYIKTKNVNTHAEEVC